MARRRYLRCRPKRAFPGFDPKGGQVSFSAAIRDQLPCRRPEGGVFDSGRSPRVRGDGVARVIVWINGTHGVGKTTASVLVQKLIPDSRILDAEMVGQTLMDIAPGLPETDNFQNWPPWRALVVETARHVLGFTGGTLIMPMTVLVEQYWREISAGFAFHRIPLRHFALHAERDVLRGRIESDTVLGPSAFRLRYLDSYAEALRSWLQAEAEVVDTTELTATEVAHRIATALAGRVRADG